jgi:hypothetical protein
VAEPQLEVLEPAVIDSAWGLCISRIEVRHQLHGTHQGSYILICIYLYLDRRRTVCCLRRLLLPYWHPCGLFLHGQRVEADHHAATSWQAFVDHGVHPDGSVIDNLVSGAGKENLVSFGGLLESRG